MMNVNVSERHDKREWMSRALSLFLIIIVSAHNDIPGAGECVRPLCGSAPPVPAHSLIETHTVRSELVHVKQQCRPVFKKLPGNSASLRGRRRRRNLWTSVILFAPRYYRSSPPFGAHSWGHSTPVQCEQENHSSEDGTVWDKVIVLRLVLT